jgi:pyruvate/2-oxoglutarate dehydrogenase complex dihydrolipoamide dehydrogenase (E3) component
MERTEKFDAVMLGSGQAANPLSSAFARAGKRVAVVERALVAGTCINYGCTPTKAMVASAQRAHMVGTAGELGIDVAGFQVNMAKVRQRKRDLVASFRSGAEKRFEKGSPELIRGEASFVSPDEIRVKLNDGGQERQIQAALIVIDTGTSVNIPAIEGLQNVPYLDNVSITELEEVPEHLLVLGGGYIAVEFGQMFRRFGSRVTIVEKGGHILAQEDDDIAAALVRILQEDGIEIVTRAEAKTIADGNGRIRLQLKSGQILEGSHLLIATGRVPNTKELNLQAAGVETDDKGYVRVNEQLQTNVPHIYATGDVTGGPAFTHISYDDYRILRDNLLGGGQRKTSDRMLPYVIYTDPQLGRVGVTEKAARKQGKRIKIGQMPMTSVARARETGETRGLMKAIVDAESDGIIGVAVLGAEGGEIMSMLQIAMMGNLKYQDLVNAVLAHPAYAESLNNLFSNLKE